MAQTSRPDPATGNVMADYEYEMIGRLFGADYLYGNPSNTATVYADSTGRQVKVRAGRSGIVQGTLWYSDQVTDEIVSGLPANTSGNPRIDRLVLRLDRSTRTVRTQYLQGTPGATPATPALTQSTSVTSGLYDFPLARWQVASGYTTIAASDIVTEAWYCTVPGQVLFRNNSRPQGALVKDGMQGFNYDTGQPETYWGGQWIPMYNVPVTAAQSANKSPLTSNTTQQATDLILPLAASAQYTFKALVFFTAGEAGDISIGMTTPSGSSWRAATRGIPSNITTPGLANVIFYSAATTSPLASFSGESGGNVMTAEIEGQINTSTTAGNLAITYAQATGSTQATTFLSKSYLTVTRFG